MLAAGAFETDDGVLEADGPVHGIRIDTQRDAHVLANLAARAELAGCRIDR